MRLQKNVYIIDALRTPMARAFSVLQEFDVSQLAVHVLRGILQRQPVLRSYLSHVIMGNTVSAGAGQNFLRRAIISAGLPVTTPGYVINHVCGSGLQAAVMATQSILTGDADIVVAGGSESASHSPELVFKRAHDEKTKRGLHESLIHDGLWCSVTDKHMGLLCEEMAQEHGISRKEQDDYAFQSYQKAIRAQAQGCFEEEILPLLLPSGKRIIVDETVRKMVDRAIFNQFPAAFKKNGTVTAGNSSLPCDGAAAVMLASQDAVEKHHLKPLARVLGYSVIAGDPHEVFTLGVDAVKQCLKRCQLKLEELDLLELSEAFAAQVVLTQKELALDWEKINVCGGDVALGHPLGAAGARILVTLTRALKSFDRKVGVACVCSGGGGAIAMAVERSKV